MQTESPRKHYFGTDGIRGTWNDAVINEAFARRFGAALAAFLKARIPDRPAAVYIGRDTRGSGEVLSQAILDGLSTAGAFVCDLGIIPTPAVALVTSHQSADLGIMVTASHNPASDNGYKVFGPGGLKLTKEDEAEIEGFIEQISVADLPKAEPCGHCFDGLAYYITYMRSMLDEDCLAGQRIVIDLANGATTATAPEVFCRWGGQIHFLGNQPNGDNINAGVGSEHPEKLGQAVREQGAVLGIAFDGDGDRVVIVDADGKAVPGEAILALLAREEAACQQLASNLLVTTIHSNGGLDRAVEQFGGRTERTDVGDRNVLYRMRELGASMGGESSGHIIFCDLIPSGDGLLSAIKFLALFLKHKCSVAELAAGIKLFPQAEGTLRVSKKLPLESLPNFSAASRAVESRLSGGKGRILVRYSGTEPKLRFLVEAESPALAEQELSTLMAAAEMDLN
jgi:phosphoglucosamine mutase